MSTRAGRFVAAVHRSSERVAQGVCLKQAARTVIVHDHVHLRRAHEVRIDVQTDSELVCILLIARINSLLAFGWLFLASPLP